MTRLQLRLGLGLGLGLRVNQGIGLPVAPLRGESPEELEGV